ncbi:MAG: glycosyltransferase family 4 protein [Phycisphaerae bacterium]|nr:glycosyltransferase family 4 protein [Phycisphaerae bacterium]
MRIVHVITRLIIGGAQENTLLSCEGQHAAGHEVTLLTGPAIGPEGTLLDRARAGGYRVEIIDSMRRSIHPIRDVITYQYLKKRIRELQPDVVHTHSSKAGIIGRWAAHAVKSGAKRPCIVHTIHGLAFTASTSPVVNGVYRRLEKWTAPITDKIICVADSMRDQSLAAHIGRPDQYVTVYSGINTVPFLNPPTPRDETRCRLRLSASDAAVGTIARLFELKGHDDLLAIAPDLCARFPDLRFLWVGDGILRESFERQIAVMNLTDRFIFAGLVPPDEVPSLITAMDIVVHPSRREGLARALPQASLCGKPVVTYNIDGAIEAVHDGVTGIIVPPFDRAQLSNALARLLENPTLRREMGEAGQEFVRQRFDAQVMVDALEKVYRSAIPQT